MILRKTPLKVYSNLKAWVKAFNGEIISKSKNGNGTRFSTQLGFNVLNILK